MTLKCCDGYSIAQATGTLDHMCSLLTCSCLFAAPVVRENTSNLVQKHSNARTHYSVIEFTWCSHHINLVSSDWALAGGHMELNYHIECYGYLRLDLKALINRSLKCDVLIGIVNTCISGSRSHASPMKFVGRNSFTNYIRSMLLQTYDLEKGILSILCAALYPEYQKQKVHNYCVLECMHTDGNVQT